MPTANNFDKINHVVVLMLENHSFDNMLGWLYSPGNPPPYDQSPPGQPTFDGLGDGSQYSNPVAPGPDALREQVYRIETIYDPVQPKKSLPNPDPGEGYWHTNVQLFQSRTPPPDPASGRMDGFIIDYRDTIASEQPSEQNPASIMGCYDPRVTHVLSMLAREFAVCDQWFCSVPSQTWPNRRFLLSGTSWGDVFNTPTDVLGPSWPTLFDKLDDAGHTWRNYHVEIPLTGILFPHLVFEHPFHFKSIHDFQRDALSGNLPDYCVIEPSYLIDPSDELPPHSVWKGEELIANVYNWVSQGKKWDETLLIVTYDEHGGCYDHASPPTAAVPPDDHRDKSHFDFKRFGVRVPAVLISPYIDKGVIYRDPEGRTIDHTSVITTVRDRFGIAEPLTQRDAHAPSLAPVLTRQTCRDESDIPCDLKPSQIGGPALEPTSEKEWREAPLSSFQRHIVESGAGVPAFRSVDAGKLAEAVRPHVDASGIETRGQALDFVWKMLAESGLEPPKAS